MHNFYEKKGHLREKESKKRCPCKAVIFSYKNDEKVDEREKKVQSTVLVKSGESGQNYEQKLLQMYYNVCYIDVGAYNNIIDLCILCTTLFVT